MSKGETVYDVAIIGAGPVGLYATYYAGLRDMRAVVLESLPQVGGQLMALYPKKMIYDVAGYPQIRAEDLVKNLEKQAKQYRPDIFTEEKVVDLRVLGDRDFELCTEKGRTVRSRSVVICAGVGAFMPRKLDIRDADKLEERGLHYIIRDPERFRGKRLLIIGGGDSALDWSLTLQDLAASITHIHMLKQFQAHEDSVARLFRSEKIEVLIHHQLKEIHGADQVEAATIFNNVDGSEKTIPVDHILCFIGYITNLGPIKDWGLELVGNAIRVNEKMETNIPGVFAAGDIVWHPAKIKLITTGFADAATAINNAKHYVEPKARVFPGHSSHTVPKKQKEMARDQDA
jgi:thioredoxin reductase (NADPH)